MNIYDLAKAIHHECMDSNYNSYRRGAFDFPEKEEWLESEWKLFRSNNPELCGLIYDEKNGEWVHKYEGGLIRVIL